VGCASPDYRSFARSPNRVVTFVIVRSVGVGGVLWPDWTWETVWSTRVGVGLGGIVALWVTIGWVVIEIKGLRNVHAVGEDWRRAERLVS
jgi:hypothetical protein